MVMGIHKKHILVAYNTHLELEKHKNILVLWHPRSKATKSCIAHYFPSNTQKCGQILHSRYRIKHHQLTPKKQFMAYMSTLASSTRIFFYFGTQDPKQQQKVVSPVIVLQTLRTRYRMKHHEPTPKRQFMAYIHVYLSF